MNKPTNGNLVKNIQTSHEPAKNTAGEVNQISYRERKMQ